MRTRGGVGAGKDGAGCDGRALPNGLHVALALTDGGLVPITVHACEGHWKVLKQDLHNHISWKRCCCCRFEEWSVLMGQPSSDGRSAWTQAHMKARAFNARIGCSGGLSGTHEHRHSMACSPPPD